MAAGFTFRQRTSGGDPTVQPIPAKDAEILTAGDMINLEAGEGDLGATADTNFLGTILHTVAAVDTQTLMVITDDDAVYGVADANARKKGDTLDLAGATGAQTVAASSYKEFVVHADCTALEPTLVRFNVGKHHASKAL